MEIAHIEGVRRVDVRRAGVRKVTDADTMTSGSRRRRMCWGSPEMVDVAEEARVEEVRVEGGKDGREEGRVEGGKGGKAEAKDRSRVVSS